MEKTAKKQTQFLLRLTPGDAIQLDAIARRLGITKSEVLRLSLSSESASKNPKTDKEMAALAGAVDSIVVQMRATDARLKNMEGLLDGAVDLLLSVSRNAQPAQPVREPVPVQPEHSEPPAKRGASWTEFRKKNVKTNPVMSEEAWIDFLKKRYTDQHGFPPDLST